MKKYNTNIAARKIVSQSVSFGTSRHLSGKEKITVVTSVGTARSHRVGLKLVADWLLHSKGKHLKNLNESDAVEYLSFRAKTVGQSAVDLGRQAINFHLLAHKPIGYIPSIQQHGSFDRAYTKGEIDLLVGAASPHLSLSIRIAVNSGLRALELITIAQVECLPESVRDAWHSKRFLGREKDAAFVVHGKGGLRRQVRLSPCLSEELRERRRPSPIQVRDREVYFDSYYDLTGGANFSAQFTTLSQGTLGTSNGAHGLRHAFAQKRLVELLCCGLTYGDAMKVLSNELGHFSVSNTRAYLRN